MDNDEVDKAAEAALAMWGSLSLPVLRRICERLIEQRREDELEPWASLGLRLNPLEIRFFEMRLHAYRLMGLHHDATATLRRYAHYPLDPAYFATYLGISLAMTGETGASIHWLSEGRRLSQSSDKPIRFLAEVELGLALLRTGDPAGFALLPTHNQFWAGHYRLDGVPVWIPGADVAGKRVLVMNQLGFGDQFLFYANLRHWQAAGAELMVTCEAEIGDLMIASLPQCRVRTAPRPHRMGAPPPAALAAEIMAFAPDLCVSLLQLPHLSALAGTAPRDFFPPYIQVPETQARAAAGWVEGLRRKHPGKALVGLFWNCSQQYFKGMDSNTRCSATQRSLTVSNIETIMAGAAARAEIHFVNLHLPAVIDICGSPAGAIDHYGPGLKDFADTAALIAQLDAVVTVDSSIANLSAMMAKPTMVLAPYSCEWRWAGPETATPWMPGVTVVRQTLANDWTHVIQTVIDRLPAFSGQTTNNGVLSQSITTPSGRGD